uniref:Gastric triacylglycerol lipase n=1 Tax=Cacopsylla melanoneura TaxID=428564 RepID=A0A8D8UDK4_9HEMI
MRYRLILVVTLTALVTISHAILQTSKESQCKNGKKKCRSILSTNYNPDVNLPTPKIIRRHGYPAESYVVETEDGYLLELHRIPYGRRGIKYGKKEPVFLQHGVLGSSSDWVIAGPDTALAYLLADKGYDVWLGNARGNTYSRSHITYSPLDLAFWDFSFHEMGYFDLPAEIDFILNKTSHAQLSYIGHSMGTTMFFVMASMRPEYNEKVLGQISLAPVAYLSHTQSPIRYLAPFALNIEKIMDWIGNGEFLPHNTMLNYVTKIACELNHREMNMCEDFLFILCGHDPYQFKMSLLPVILGHTPAGGSTRTLVHYAQFIDAGKFRQFDYGKDKNFQFYNSSFPPKYDIKSINTKVAFFYAGNDLLTNDQDVKEFYSLLPNPVGLYKVNFTFFNHLDFLWAKDVRSLVYNDLLVVLKSFNKTRQRSEVLTVNNVIPQNPHVISEETTSPWERYLQLTMTERSLYATERRLSSKRGDQTSFMQKISAFPSDFGRKFEKKWNDSTMREVLNNWMKGDSKGDSNSDGE